MGGSVSFDVQRGWRAFGSEGQLIGSVDAVFADYLLVRTSSILPVDLYVPRDALVGGANGRVILRARASEAYERWHRPLKRAPHE
jgi:hypothetical protein